MLTKTITFRNGIIRTYDLVDSKTRVDYVLALTETVKGGDRDADQRAAKLAWQWIKEGKIEYKDFRRIFRAICKDY